MPGAADHRAGEAPGQRILLRHGGDIDVALLEDAVVGDQADRILEQVGTRLSSQSAMSVSSFSGASMWTPPGRNQALCMRAPDTRSKN